MKIGEISGEVAFIPGAVNIGLIKLSKNSIILIDTGLDDSTAKKILKVLNQENLKIHSIINTHSHADHCGGNSYIQKKTGTKIYAPEIESTFIEHPILEPWYLYSGAAPFKDLKNKFLAAKPSIVNTIINKNQNSLLIEGVELNIVSLPGHSPNQIGIEVDSVCFCADVLFSDEILKKHKISFFSDIETSLQSLNFLKKRTDSFYVPSHATPSQKVKKIVDTNIKTINDISNLILRNLITKKTTEQLLERLCSVLEIEISHPSQYFLLKTPVQAYLSYLHQNNQVKFELRDNQLYWRIADTSSS